MQVIKHECHDWGYSVLVDTGRGFNVWFDIEVKDNEIISTDWNQYIFHTNDYDDVMRMEFQDNCDNFLEVDGVAVDYLYKTI